MKWSPKELPSSATCDQLRLTQQSLPALVRTQNFTAMIIATAKTGTDAPWRYAAAVPEPPAAVVVVGIAAQHPSMVVVVVVVVVGPVVVVVVMPVVVVVVVVVTVVVVVVVVGPVVVVVVVGQVGEQNSPEPQFCGMLHLAPMTASVVFKFIATNARKMVVVVVV